jgi:Ser/Thr protein kinase RdoA (MazF antagonist)
VCHGDLSLDNLHVTEDHRIAFYDLDSVGPGWRASDPYGVFQYQPRDNWDAFLAGCTAVRPFGATDCAAVPYFVVAQQLWNMGREITFWATWAGSSRVNDAYFDRKLTGLRAWDGENLRQERHPGGAPQRVR